MLLLDLAWITGNSSFNHFSLIFYFLVCRFKVHRRCAVRARNNCKWTTVQSLRGEECKFDESDPVS